jgi:hypothetical protein
MVHYLKMLDLMYFLITLRYSFSDSYILYLGVEYEIRRRIKNSICIYVCVYMYIWHVYGVLINEAGEIKKS